MSAPVSTTSVVAHTGRLPGVRLNEHIAHPKSALVFQHACKLGAEGDRVKAFGLALPFRRAGLAEVQERTSPIQAEKLRPDRKVLGSATLATRAVASIGPTPGM